MGMTVHVDLLCLCRLLSPTARSFSSRQNSLSSRWSRLTVGLLLHIDALIKSGALLSSRHPVPFYRKNCLQLTYSCTQKTIRNISRTLARLILCFGGYLQHAGLVAEIRSASNQDRNCSPNDQHLHVLWQFFKQYSLFSIGWSIFEQHASCPCSQSLVCSTLTGRLPNALRTPDSFAIRIFQ